jgi:hypothetical protein
MDVLKNSYNYFCIPNIKKINHSYPNNDDTNSHIHELLCCSVTHDLFSIFGMHVSYKYLYNIIYKLLYNNYMYLSLIRIELTIYCF